MAKKRVGIFGGTFDPPHVGHLLLAETVREQLRLDEVLFVPCNEPPHKESTGLTGAMHRYAMVVAATLQNPSFTACAVEVSREGKSFSIDTVRSLIDEQGPETELFFICGLDSFLQIRTWHRYEELLESCSFVVVSRPASSFDSLRDALPEPFHERITELRDGAVVDEDVRGLRIFLSDAVLVDVASTEIRARVRDGRSIRYRVPPEVEQYVRTHELYAGAAVSEVKG